MKKRTSTLLCLSSLLLLGAASAQDASTSYSAETYGGASGDVPLRGLGLVLELVDGGTPDARLRLFGGPPGQEAAILLSTEAAELAGPHGSTRLVQDDAITLRGAFDWRGFYEVPLDDSGASFHAQGLHVGIFDLAPGGEPLVQFSNGVQVFPTPTAEEPLGFDDLLPHLPEAQGILPITTPLAERLQVYLNSPGDSTRIKLHVEGNGGPLANAGLEGDIEFQVLRTEDGHYEVRVGSDVAVKAGVELAEGLEANASGGYGATRVFRFYSAPGAARGIFGLLLSLRFPDLTPGAWISDSGVLGDAEDAVQALQTSIELARSVAEEAEAMLWGVLDVAMQKSRDQRAKALSKLQYAAKKLASAGWMQRPYWASQVALRTAIYTAAHAKYVAAKTAREQGQNALDHARQIVEQHREELRAVLAAAARVGRVASAIAQLRGYTTEHYAGTEVRFKQKAGAELGIPLPVKVPGLGAGVSSEVEMVVSVFFDGLWGEDESRIVVTRQLEQADKARAAAVVGVEYQRKTAGAVVNTFEFGGGSFTQTMDLSLGRDTFAKAAVGTWATVGGGIGRAKSVALSRDFTIDEDFELGAFLMGEGRDRLGDTEVGFQLQDRLVRSIDVGLIVSVGGNGGGFDLDIEWADQGRLLSRTTTIREAVDAIVDGAEQLIDPESGAVVNP